MVMSWHGNAFHITGTLWGKSTRKYRTCDDAFICRPIMSLNKWLICQWSETPLCSHAFIVMYSHSTMAEIANKHLIQLFLEYCETCQQVDHYFMLISETVESMILCFIGISHASMPWLQVINLCLILLFHSLPINAWNNQIQDYENAFQINYVHGNIITIITKLRFFYWFSLRAKYCIQHTYSITYYTVVVDGLVWMHQAISYHNISISS